MINVLNKIFRVGTRAKREIFINKKMEINESQYNQEYFSTYNPQTSEQEFRDIQLILYDLNCISFIFFFFTRCAMQ